MTTNGHLVPIAPAVDSTIFREVSEEEVRTTAPDADEVEMHGAALPHRYYRRRMERKSVTENAPPL